MKNEVTLIGRVGNNPEFKTSVSGNEYAKLSIATSRPHKNESGQYENITTWHNNIIAFGKLINAVKLLKKGSKVYVKGYLKYSSGIDDSGITRYYTSIILTEVLFLDKKESSCDDLNTENDEIVDDIPF